MEKGAFKLLEKKSKWIVYASKEFKNNVSMTEQLFDLMINLDWVNANLPVNEAQIIAAGFSGGGMVAAGMMLARGGGKKAAGAKSGDKKPEKSNGAGQAQAQAIRNK